VGPLACDPFTCAGSLAFRTLVSLAPVVIVAESMIRLVPGEQTAPGPIVAQRREVMGREAGGRPVAPPWWPSDEVALAWAGVAVADRVARRTLAVTCIDPAAAMRNTPTAALPVRPVRTREGRRRPRA